MEGKNRGRKRVEAMKVGQDKGGKHEHKIRRKKERKKERKRISSSVGQSEWVAHWSYSEC